jgi:hypothetical protein
MFDYPDASGNRAVYEPLADEVARQIANFAALEQGTTVAAMNDLDTTALDWAAHVMETLTEDGRA